MIPCGSVCVIVSYDTDAALFSIGCKALETVKADGSGTEPTESFPGSRIVVKRESCYNQERSMKRGFMSMEK